MQKTVFTFYFTDPGATRSLDDSENEPSARNNVVDPESPRSEPEQENDCATVCEKIETSNGFKTPEMVSWHICL